MKQVVSVSLGSPGRDHEITLEIPGCRLLVQRRGAGGSLVQAMEILRSLDGKVDALGLGGVNLYLRAGKRYYTLRDGARLASVVKETPLVDGRGIKDTIEVNMVSFLQKRLGWPRQGQVVLITSALDRYGLADALEQAGCRLLIGDALFALGLPLPFRSLALFRAASYATLPLLSKLPITMLYPLGGKQEKSCPGFERYFRQADIIAGDFHFLRYRLPQDLEGKDILTSTIASADVEDLQKRGVRWLVTTSPSFDGRSFGSNVLEAICVALLAEQKVKATPGLYPGLFNRMGWEPRMEKLN